MAGLLPLILELAPQMAKFLFGARGVAAAAAVGKIAQAVTGTTEVAGQIAALADPAKAAELRLELAKLTAQLDVEQRQADLAELQVRLADSANARAMTLNLAGRSAIAWGAPIVTAVVLITFGLMLAMVLTHQLPQGSEALANVMLGSLAAMATSAVQFWLGSSSSSRGKDRVIAAAARSLATSTPGPIVLAPPA